MIETTENETNSKLKIAIVGGAPSSRHLAPFDDLDWKIWTCSTNQSNLKRIDEWFELHDTHDLQSDQWSPWAVGYIDFLRKAQFKVWMQTKELVPNAEIFPKDEILEAFPEGHFAFTSTVAWQLALAIHLGAERIGIWGVDMTAGGEYEYERPGLQYWIHVAKTRGIKVFIPDESDLGREIPLYGYSDANPTARKLKAYSYELRAKLADTNNKIKALQDEIMKARDYKNLLEGAMDNNLYVRRTFFAWSGPDL